MIEKTMEVDRMEDVISVFGSFDQNLRMIETEYNVRVTDRDEQIHITGEAENVLYAEKAIAGLLSLADIPNFVSCTTRTTRVRKFKTA